MLNFEITVAVILFGIGLYGVMTQKSFLKIFFSLEMLLNSVILILASTAVEYGLHQNLTIAYIVIAVATLEASVGVLIFLAVNKLTDRTDIGDENGS